MDLGTLGNLQNDYRYKVREGAQVGRYLDIHVIIESLQISSISGGTIGRPENVLF